MTNQDLISIIREAMAECGKYNEKQKDPFKFGLKCRVSIPQKFKGLIT